MYCVTEFFKKVVNKIDLHTCTKPYRATSFEIIELFVYSTENIFLINLHKHKDIFQIFVEEINISCMVLCYYYAGAICYNIKLK